MGLNTAVWLVIALAVVAANLPFLSERIGLIGPRRTPKAFWWRLLEWVLMGVLTLAVGMGLEAHLGQRMAQGWEFYAAFTFLFATLAFPGFVWRYLIHRRHG